jgi:hypothetical protein
MKKKELFVIKVKKSGRWRPTIWTRGPVSKRAADKAILRAQKAFPKSEYTITRMA